MTRSRFFGKSGHVVPFLMVLLTPLATLPADAQGPGGPHSATASGVHAGPAALVTVEIPRGCGNTKSTFTPGLDHVNLQIKFR